jgi:hypothetical protein
MPSSRTRQPSSSPMMTKTRCFIGAPYGKTSGPRFITTRN